MRPGSNKRPRGRNNGGGGGGGNMQHNGGGRPRPPHRSQTFDSNGPGIKIRGNAYQVFERYVALAREAVTSGDRVAAENFYQHAEHYFRVLNANGENPNHFQQRAMTPADLDSDQMDGDGYGDREAHAQHQQNQPHHQQQHDENNESARTPEDAPIG